MKSDEKFESCPKCGSTRFVIRYIAHETARICASCGFKWTEETSDELEKKYDDR